MGNGEGEGSDMTFLPTASAARFATDRRELFLLLLGTPTSSAAQITGSY
jgi:hypothetical protein